MSPGYCMFLWTSLTRENLTPYSSHCLSGFLLLVGILFFFFFNLFILLFLAALGLCCCTQAFSSCGERGLLFVEVHGLLIVVASLVAEHRL